MSDRTVRMRLSRAKGFDLHAASRALNGRPAVNVARPGPWGNPFVVGKHGTRADCVYLFKGMLAGFVWVSVDQETADAQIAYLKHADASLEQLRGKNLACWCTIEGPCHADALLELANVESTET